MRKKCSVAALAVFISIGSFFFNRPLYAQSENDLEHIQDRRAHIKNDLSDAENKLTNLVSEIEDLNEEIEQRNKIVEEKQNMIQQTDEDIDETVKDMEALQTKIEELQKDIDKRYDLLKERMTSYQQSGGPISILNVLFGAESFSDLINRAHLVGKITDSDASLIKAFEADKQSVAEKQQLVFQKLNELNELKEEQEKNLSILNEEQRKNEARKEKLEGKQKELVEYVEELEKEDEKLNALEEKTKQRIAAATEAKANPAPKVAKTKNETNQPAQSKEKKKASNGSKKTEEKNDKQSFTVTATAYTVESAGENGITSTGIDLTENPDAKVIAVDPSVIPLGSIVHVEGYGHAIAGDVGGDIKGKRIDVFVPTNREAIQWGVREVQVTIQ